jgi:hypothetical protein
MKLIKSCFSLKTSPENGWYGYLSVENFLPRKATNIVKSRPPLLTPGYPQHPRPCSPRCRPRPDMAPVAPRGHERPPASTRCHLLPLAAIRGHPQPPAGTRCYPQPFAAANGPLRQFAAPQKSHANLQPLLTATPHSPPWPHLAPRDP